MISFGGNKTFSLRRSSIFFFIVSLDLFCCCCCYEEDFDIDLDFVLDTDLGEPKLEYRLLLEFFFDLLSL